MNLHFLDVFGADFASGLLWVFFVVIILIMLIETPVMILMKYNTRFQKAFGDSVLVNLASLAVGFILVYSNVSLPDSSFSILIYYAITVVVEFGVLYLLNTKHKISRTLAVCVVMNIVSYAMLYAFTKG